MLSSLWRARKDLYSGSRRGQEEWNVVGYGVRVPGVGMGHQVEKTGSSKQEILREPNAVVLALSGKWKVKLKREKAIFFSKKFVFYS